MGNSSTKKEKSRYFTFLIYPESAPKDWIEQLKLLGIPMAISPIHDSDLKENGEEGFKKPHYHVLYVASNPVTADSVRVKIKRLFGNYDVVGYVQIIRTSVENTYKYLTHESDDAIKKHKHVYDKNEIIHLNNFDIDRYIVFDVEMKDDAKNLLIDIIDEYQIANIHDIKEIFKVYPEKFNGYKLNQIYDVLYSYSSLFKMLMDGYYQRGFRSQYGKIFDEKNGEIIDLNKRRD